MKARHAYMLVAVFLVLLVAVFLPAKAPVSPPPATAKASQHPPQAKPAQQPSQAKPAPDPAGELGPAQRQLAADFRAFSTAHASDAPEARRQAMEAFQQQHQSRAEALRVMAQAAAKTGPVAAIPMTEQVAIPENASPAMEELLVRQAQMRNAQVQLMNSVRDAQPEVRQTALREWHEKNQPAMAALREQAAKVAAESRQKSLPLPPPPRIPDAASPELRDSLLQRYAQIKQHVETENRLRSLPPDQQEAARRASRQPPASNRENIFTPPSQTASDPQP